MKNVWGLLKPLVFFLLLSLAFWIGLFFVERVVFVGLNSIKAVDVPMDELATAFVRGMLFDVSIWGYISLIVSVVYGLVVWAVRPKPIVVGAGAFTAVVGAVVAFLMPANAITYGAWGHHVDAGSLLMVMDTPQLALASLETWTEVVYVVVCGLMAFTAVLTVVKFSRRSLALSGNIPEPKTLEWKERAGLVLASLVLGGLMIVPIRGGTGIAPLNTGRAFFSQHIFANHTAINPLWNFMYSLKRVSATEARYDFMEDEKMEKVFSSLRNKGDERPSIFATERPNIVVILLESFSAHGIGYLGGVNATPNIDSLRHEGVYFNNFFASADRSGKGLVAVMCGHPSLPNLRIIQYPQKTQNLPFVARKLRDAGYASQTFLYGGDLNFNNFNSLVNMAGFDNVVTENDFSDEEMGDKWGAHDEYTFRRLLSIMDKQSEPFFNFFFTLSSHEPYTVPMEKVLDDKYLNSMAYTDRCLGEFMREARTREWFDRTVFVLVADHGHGGPENVGVTDRRKFNIPLILTGGGVVPRDSMVTTYGSQTDIAATLMSQLGIDGSDFVFSRDLLAKGASQFAFFDFSDGYGWVTPRNYQVRDNEAGAFVRNDDVDADTVCGMAYLQKVAADFRER